MNDEEYQKHLFNIDKLGVKNYQTMIGVTKFFLNSYEGDPTKTMTYMFERLTENEDFTRDMAIALFLTFAMRAVMEEELKHNQTH